jgi:hypothetical protein
MNCSEQKESGKSIRDGGRCGRSYCRARAIISAVRRCSSRGLGLDSEDVHYKNIGPVIAGPIHLLWASTLRSVQPNSLQSCRLLFAFLFLLLSRHDQTSLYTRAERQDVLSAPYNKQFANEWKLNKWRPWRAPHLVSSLLNGVSRLNRRLRLEPGRRRLLLIPMGNLDNSGAMGELLHQRVSHRPIRRVKIGIPLVQ